MAEFNNHEPRIDSVSRTAQLMGEDGNFASENKDRPLEAARLWKKNMAMVKKVSDRVAGNKLFKNTNALIAMINLVLGTAQRPDYMESCKYALNCVAKFWQAGAVRSLGVHKMLLDTKSCSLAVKSKIQLEGRNMWP